MKQPRVSSINHRIAAGGLPEAIPKRRKYMTEISMDDKTLKVSVNGSDPLTLQLDSTGAATLRLEIIATCPTAVTGYTYAEPPR